MIRQRMEFRPGHRLRLWGLSFRLAVADLKLAKLRSALMALSVATPVALAVTAALVQYNLADAGERLARHSFGSSDGLVKVTRFASVEVTLQRGASIDIAPIGQKAKSPAASIAELLPKGSTWTTAPSEADLHLATGGVAQVTRLDLASPLTSGIIDLSDGRAPTLADSEVALTQPMAEELGLTEANGGLKPDSVLETSSGQVLKVVGLTAPDSRTASGNQAQVVMAPAARRDAMGIESTEYLIDVPESSATSLRRLQSALAAQGAAFLPADAVRHPESWGLPNDRPATDPRALVTGLLVVLVGSLQVLLIVGCLFAIDARRRSRELGLLYACGATAADMRRRALAHGATLGLVAGAAGASLGIAGFYAIAPTFERVSEQLLLGGIDWMSVGTISMLGGLTAVIAVLPTAWSVSRSEALQSVKGSYHQRGSTGDWRGRGTALVVSLYGFGSLLITVAGAKLLNAGSTSMKPPTLHPTWAALLALGFLSLLASAWGLAKLAINASFRLGPFAPFAMRMALRDSFRNRGRTTAATVSIAAIVASAAMAASGAAVALQLVRQNIQNPTRTVAVYLDSGATVQTVRQLDISVHAVVGGVTQQTAYRMYGNNQPDTTLVLKSNDGLPIDVRVVKQQALTELVGGPGDAAMRTFRRGGIVSAVAGGQEFDVGRLALMNTEGDLTNIDTLPIAYVQDEGTAGLADFGLTWISRAAASNLGLRLVPTSVLYTIQLPLSSVQAERLSLRGITAYAPDAESAVIPRIVNAGLLVAVLLAALVAAATTVFVSQSRRDDEATLTAVGATPVQRRKMAAHFGAHLGVTSVLIGLAVALPVVVLMSRVDGLDGLPIPKAGYALLLLPVITGCTAWIVTPSRLQLTRRLDA